MACDSSEMRLAISGPRKFFYFRFFVGAPGMPNFFHQHPTMSRAMRAKRVAAVDDRSKPATAAEDGGADSGTSEATGLGDSHDQALQAKQKETGLALSKQPDEGLSVDNCTDALQCRAYGSGLQEATVRQHAFFWIEAANVHGQKLAHGGDSFFVAIRGPSQVRARVIDNADGSYLCVWKPTVSGTYSIAISHFGSMLPGAPFTLQATTSLPCAARCAVRGDALHQATSRCSHSFEVMFRDRLGQTAHAVELDVFVEPVPTDSPRNRQLPPDKAAIEVAAAAEAEAAEVKPAAGEKKLQREAAKRGGGSGPTTAARGAASSAGASKQLLPSAPPPASASSPAAAVDSATARPALDATTMTGAAVEHIEQENTIAKYRTFRVQISKVLVVRRQPALNASPIGKLYPGQVRHGAHIKPPHIYASAILTLRPVQSESLRSAARTCARFVHTFADEHR